MSNIYKGIEPPPIHCKYSEFLKRKNYIASKRPFSTRFKRIFLDREDAGLEKYYDISILVDPITKQNAIFISTCVEPRLRKIMKKEKIDFSGVYYLTDQFKLDNIYNNKILNEVIHLYEDLRKEENN